MPNIVTLMRSLTPASAVVSLVITVALFQAHAVSAQTAGVTYQGRLADTGVPANGTLNFMFTIFDASVGGGAHWSETIPNVTVTNGLFTVVLGQTVPLNATIFNGSPRWIEIVVQGTPLSPRQELTSAAGAIFATVAGSFSGGFAGEVTGTQGATVVSNAVSTNTANAIVRRDASGNIAAGTVTAALNGNATSATSAANFSGSLAGEVTGTQGATVVSNAVSTNTANAVVRRDASGNIAAGTVTAALNGNATSATSAANFSGSLAGEVTGTQGATVVSNAVPTNTANAVVRRDASGNFAAGLVTLSGNLDLPHTSSASVGVVSKSGNRFLHNFGTNNTFLGFAAGNMTLTGSSNTAVGSSSLFALTSGGQNSAFGWGALGANTGGGNNSAYGAFALGSLSSGDQNIGIGAFAGGDLSSGSLNIYIGNAGMFTETNAIRIGASQTAAYMAGISGQTSASGVAVFVNGLGKLGTLTSSLNFKEEIADLAAESNVLMKLRPVAFYYKPEYDDTRTRQYGLVAEEVAEVAPQLVVFDEAGAPQTVRYHFVNAMLLNEAQKQQRTLEEQRARIKDLEARLARLEALVNEGR